MIYNKKILVFNVVSFQLNTLILILYTYFDIQTFLYYLFTISLNFQIN